MFKLSLKILTIAAFLSSTPLLTTAQKVKQPAITNKEWERSFQPFRIAGNLYYVGTYDLASYLITTPKGNILINTGLASSATQIENNIKTLGFKLADTKILLTTQAHYDHNGAMAFIKKKTHAQLIVDENDAAELKDGGSSDYALGNDTPSYQPVQPDRLLHNGDTITLGNMHLVMLHHPGHTKGSCSFLFTVKDEKRSWKVLIANMPSIVTDKPFNNMPGYPNVAADYAYTFKAMKDIRFDIWLSSHASQFDMHKKHHPNDPYNPAAFIDQVGYDAALEDLQKKYDEKMKQH